MKKVLVLNPYMPTLGGGEKHMGYLCKFIEDYYENVSIDILVHNYNNIDIYSPNYPDIDQFQERFNLSLEKTSILKLNLKKPSCLKDHFRNKKIIERLSASYDLFINFMYQSKHIGRAKKNIYSCMFPARPYQFDGFFKNAAAKYLDYRFKHSYDFFMTNSQFTNHWQQHFWRTENKNKIVYPPVFSLETIEKRKVEKKRNIILSVGRFFVGAHNKKQDILADFFIRNISHFKDWELHLVGALSNYPEDIAYVEKIKSKINGYPIFLHVNLSFDILKQLYSEAKIFWHATGYNERDDLFPEKMEHFGITTVEAMSYGVVPIVIRKGGQTEIVEEGRSGFLWDSEDECISKTIKVIEEEGLRKQLSHGAYERSKDFTVEKFYQHTKEVFDAI